MLGLRHNSTPVTSPSRAERSVVSISREKSACPAASCDCAVATVSSYQLFLVEDMLGLEGRSRNAVQLAVEFCQSPRSVAGPIPMRDTKAEDRMRCGM
jgi:hypothetical protein